MQRLTAGGTTKTFFVFRQSFIPGNCQCGDTGHLAGFVPSRRSIRDGNSTQSTFAVQEGCSTFADLYNHTRTPVRAISK